MSHRLNITRIKAVANALGKLKDQVVFVGGATVSLYADRQAEEVRPTDDVDVLVEISTRSGFAALENQLREMGFRNDVNATFIGRYLLNGIVVDVIPTDEKILGFSNRWYAEGFRTAIDYKIDEQHTVKIFAPPYFIASKLEAFKHRGKKDGRTSSDFEDLVFVWENRKALWEEMSSAPPDVREYLITEINRLLRHRYFEEWIESHTAVYSGSAAYIFEEMEKFIAR